MTSALEREFRTGLRLRKRTAWDNVVPWESAMDPFPKRHPHKPPHNYPVHMRSSYVFPLIHKDSIVVRILAKVFYANLLVDICDHIGILYLSEIPQLITQRSVVQIHPPQPIPS